MSDTKQSVESTLPTQEELKSIFLHNFNKQEISLIVSAINKVLHARVDRKKLVFAKTTEESLKMNVREWIEDTAGDHLYLLEHPPTMAQRQQAHKNSPDNKEQ